MAEGRKSKFPALRLILLAIVSGALVGAVAVYVTSGPAGNNAGAPQFASVSQADAVCEAKSDLARQIASSAVGDVAAMLPADPPQSLATLAFNDPEGKPMTLADHAGKTVLLNLWATWCAPCREEMPALDSLQKEAGSDSFEVVAINVDTGDDTKPKKFLSETGIGTLGYYRDNTLGVFNALKGRGLALGLPVTLLIDDEGCLMAYMNGPADWAGTDASRLIAAAVAD